MLTTSCLSPLISMYCSIVGDVPVHVLRHAVASYPTAAELWLRLLEELPPEFRRPPAS